jgi:MFS family permease
VIATRLLSRVDFKPVRQPIDFVGAALLVVAVVTLVLAISWSSRDYGWLSPATIGLVAVNVAATAVFIWWEGRVDEPFVPLRLFADPTFRWCVMMAGPLSITLSTCNTFLPLFFQAVGGVSPTNSGLLLAPILVGLVSGSAVCGRRISATGHYRIWMVVGSSMVALGALTLTTLRDSAFGITVAVVGMLMIGTGIGMSNPTATIAAQNSLDQRDLGVGTSMLMFFRTLAAALGLALYGTIFSTRISDRLKPELIDQPRLIRDLAEPARAQALNVLTGGVRLLFIVSVPLTILGSLAARAIREQPLRETARATEQTQSAAGSLGH